MVVSMGVGSLGNGVVSKGGEEAAEVFGASFWQRLRHVTLPLMRPSIQVALILRTILAFQAFAVAQAIDSFLE